MTASNVFRWGVLGCGSIANRFSNDVARLEGHHLQAVASRDAGRAAAYAQKFDTPTQYTGTDAYEALVADPNIDAIYVTTPHNFHKAHTLLALRAGKPVLCEKPFAVTHAEATEMVQEARDRRIFLMEAVWTLCFPIMTKLRELLTEGAIGTARMLEADFGFRGAEIAPDGKLIGYNAEARLFNPALAGGSLLDVGVYPLTLAHWLFGAPDQAKAVGVLGNSGVDENVGMLLRFPGGEVALASSSLQVTTPWRATVIGTKGRIEVESPWWCPKALTLYCDGKEPETIRYVHAGEGFQFEAMHVADCVRRGKAESDVIPLSHTLRVMQTLDTLRAELGLRYPVDAV